MSLNCQYIAWLVLEMEAKLSYQAVQAAATWGSSTWQLGGNFRLPRVKCMNLGGSSHTGGKYLVVGEKYLYLR